LFRFGGRQSQHAGRLGAETAEPRRAFGRSCYMKRLIPSRNHTTTCNKVYRTVKWTAWRTHFLRLGLSEEDSITRLTTILRQSPKKYDDPFKTMVATTICLSPVIITPLCCKVEPLKVDILYDVFDNRSMGSYAFSIYRHHVAPHRAVPYRVVSYGLYYMNHMLSLQRSVIYCILSYRVEFDGPKHQASNALK
jgi:hypothetical protein